MSLTPTGPFPGNTPNPRLFPDTAMQAIPHPPNPYLLPPRVIGINGEAGHGKNMLGAFIASYDRSFQLAAFANPLKNYTATIFGVPEYMLHDPVEKERSFPGGIVEMDEYIPQMTEILGIPIEARGKQATTPRELLQLFGTEYVRSVCPDYWVELMAGAVDRDVVITDVRFSNEAAAIRRLGGRVIKIVRNGFVSKTPKHVSEEFDFEPDAIFRVGSGDLNGMRDAAFAAVALVNGPRMFPNVNVSAESF